MSKTVPEGTARPIAERERGRARLGATTVTVGLASVAVSGVVAVALPGPVSHATGPSTGTSPGANSGRQGTSQDNNGGQGITPPGYAPASGGGGGAPVSTSGGTHSGF